MRKEYCDICGADTSEGLESLFGSRKIIIESIFSGEQQEMTLCDECKNTLWYYMNNRDLLLMITEEMSLRNRVRFLFKKPLKYSDKLKEGTVRVSCSKSR